MAPVKSRLPMNSSSFGIFDGDAAAIVLALSTPGPTLLALLLGLMAAFRRERSLRVVVEVVQ